MTQTAAKEKEVEVEVLRGYQPKEGDKIKKGVTTKLPEGEASRAADLGIVRKL